MSVKKVEKKPVTTTEQVDLSRVYKGEGQIHHDLYKLSTEEMVKNTGWGNSPFYVNVDHCHFYHSVDSSGKVQTHSTHVGGHFHKIKVTHTNPNERPTVECISGPITTAIRKVRGQKRKVEVPASDLDEEGKPYDTHTHTVSYIRSERVPIRKISPHAVAIETAEAQKVAPVAGILS